MTNFGVGMKAVLVFLAIIMMAFAAVTTQEDQNAVLLEQLFEIEQGLSSEDYADVDMEAFVDMESAPLPAAALKRLVADAQKQMAATPAGAIPKALMDRIAAVSLRIKTAQVTLDKLTGDYVSNGRNDTWSTPGQLIGEHAGMSGANADRLLKIFKHTQNHRKISNDEILDNFDYAETK